MGEYIGRTEEAEGTSRGFGLFGLFGPLGALDSLGLTLVMYFVHGLIPGTSPARKISTQRTFEYPVEPR